jgi:hypothetical protein
VKSIAMSIRATIGSAVTRRRRSGTENMIGPKNIFFCQASVEQKHCCHQAETENIIDPNNIFFREASVE